MSAWRRLAAVRSGPSSDRRLGVPSSGPGCPAWPQRTQRGDAAVPQGTGHWGAARGEGGTLGASRQRRRARLHTGPCSHWVRATGAGTGLGKAGDPLQPGGLLSVERTHSGLLSPGMPMTTGISQLRGDLRQRWSFLIGRSWKAHTKAPEEVPQTPADAAWPANPRA